MNYSIFSLSITGIIVLGILLINYLWDKCVVQGNGLEGNYCSDDDSSDNENSNSNKNNETSISSVSADDQTDAEIEEAVEQYVLDREELFYKCLNDEIKAYRQMLESHAVMQNQEPMQSQIRNRRRNKSF